MPNSYVAAKQTYLNSNEVNKVNAFAWYANKHRELVNMDPTSAAQKFSLLEPEHQEQLRELFNVDYSAQEEDKSGWTPLKIFTDPIGSLFTGAKNYSNLLSVGFRYADAKIRGTGQTWDEVNNGESYFNEKIAKEVDNFYGPAIAKIARLAASGKSPGEILLQLNSQDLDLFERYYQGDEIFDKAIAEYNDAKVSPGRTAARGIGALFGIRPEAGDHGVKRTLYDRGSGALDLTYQIIFDPLTWLTGGVGTGIKFAGLGVTKGTRNLKALLEAPGGLPTKNVDGVDIQLSNPTEIDKMFSKKPIKNLWDNIGGLVKKWEDGDASAFNDLNTYYGDIARPLALLLKKNKVYDANSAQEFFNYADNVKILLSGNQKIKTAAMPVWNFRRKASIAFKRTLVQTLHGKTPKDVKFKPKLTTKPSEEIFVFGSNLRGIHGAGAALTAVKEYGAQKGKGVGIQGRAYAIPTKSVPSRNPSATLPLKSIQTYVNDFINFAKKNPDKQFNLTAIGTGLAGLKPADIGPMFKDAPLNVKIPKEFAPFVSREIDNFSEEILSEQDALNLITRLGTKALTAEDEITLGQDFVINLRTQNRIANAARRMTERAPMSPVVFVSDDNVMKTDNVIYEIARTIYPRFWARAIQGEFVKATPEERLVIYKGLLIQMAQGMGITNDIKGVTWLQGVLRKYDGVYSVETPISTTDLAEMRASKTGIPLDPNSQVTIQSGGATGADSYWATSSAKLGIRTTAHSFPKHKANAGERLEHTQEELNANDKFIDAIALKLTEVQNRFWNRVKTQDQYKANLIRRNYYQVSNADAVIAIGKIIPGEGVSGGTGWTVQMGIQLGKPVYVFDTRSERWYRFGVNQSFEPVDINDIPVYTNFAGVGSHSQENFTEAGQKAIDDYLGKINTELRVGQDANLPLGTTPTGVVYNVKNLRVADTQVTQETLPENTVYVGRAIDNNNYKFAASPYQNPFKITDDVTREQALEKFKKYAENKLRKNPKWLDPLIGKNLADWCYPEACHADILNELIQKNIKKTNLPTPPLTLDGIIDNVLNSIADEVSSTQGVLMPGKNINAQTAVTRDQVSDMQEVPKFGEWLRKSQELNKNPYRPLVGYGLDEINNNWSFLTLAPRLGIRSAIDELLFYGLDASIAEILMIPVARATSRALRKASTGSQDLTITRKIGFALSKSKKGYDDSTIQLVLEEAIREKNPRIWTSYVAHQAIKEIPFRRTLSTMRVLPNLKLLEGWIDDLINSGRMADFGQYLQTGMTAGFVIKSGSQLNNNQNLKPLDSASAVNARLNFNVEPQLAEKGLKYSDELPGRIALGQNGVGDREFLAAWYGSIVGKTQFDPVASKIIFKNINNRRQAIRELYRHYMDPRSAIAREQLSMMVGFKGTTEDFIRKANDEFTVFKSFFVDSNGEVIAPLVDSLYRIPPKLQEKINKGLKLKRDPEEYKRVTSFSDNEFLLDDLTEIFESTGRKSPVAIHGYNVVSVAAADNVGGFLLHLRDAGFSYMDKQLAMLAREPMYISRYLSNRQQLKKMEETEVASRIAASDDVEPESIMIARAIASEKATSIAANNARERTLQYIDNPLVRSHFAFHMRNFARFYRATEDFYRRAGRLASNNPQALIRLRLSLLGLDASGFIHEDENGEQYFLYPGDDIILQAANMVSEGFGGSPALDVNPIRFGSKINMIAPSLDPDSALPSLSGPIAAIPVFAVRKIIGSSFADSFPGGLEQKIDRYTLGAYSEFSPFLETVVPTSIKRILSTMNRSESNKQVASAIMAAGVYEAAAGRSPDEVDTWAELQEKKTSLLVTAANIMTVRNMLGMFAPAGIQSFEVRDIPKYILESDTTRMSSEYYKIVDGLKKKGSSDPYGEAIALWTRSNPGRLVYTIPRTENIGLIKIDKTKEAADWVRQNVGLMNKYPQVGALFAPQIGEFDINAYNYLKLQGYTGNRNIDDFLLDLYTESTLREDKQTKSYYASLIASTNDPQTKSMYRQMSTEASASIKSKNSLITQRLSQVRYSTYEQQNALVELETMIASGDAPDLGRARILQQMITVVNSAMYKIDPINGGDLLDPEQVKSVRRDAITQLERIAGDDPNLMLAINRVFEPILEKARSVVYQ